jgi:hypothetical protein
MTSSNNSKSKAAAATKCVLTFQDVVRVIPNTISISKPQLFLILQRMTVLSPGWIQWIDPKSADQN